MRAPTPLAQTLAGLALTGMTLAGLALVAPAVSAPADPVWMPGGPLAAPPAGYLDWCRRNPETCGASGQDAEAAKLDVTKRYWSAVFAAKATPKPQAARVVASPPGQAGAYTGPTLAWTEANRRLLDDVNRRVNRAILEQDDRVTYGVEDYWAIPTLKGNDRYGDCEDYVLMKRRDLIAAGVPAETLFIALVEAADHVPHAVLLAATDRGEMVLDNHTPWIVPWTQTFYRWVERQAPGDAFHWIVPDTPPPPLRGEAAR